MQFQNTASILPDRTRSWHECLQTVSLSIVTQVREIAVPDIGDFESVDIIEVLVAPGDVIRAEDPLVTLESDKATMDVPAPFGGTISELKVQTGDKVALKYPRFQFEYARRIGDGVASAAGFGGTVAQYSACLLYTSDAADE